jgi:hypothetical protein
MKTQMGITTSWRSDVTKYQWLVLFVAWLGWVFDAMDATIYAIVLHPARHELLQSSSATAVTPEQIGWYGGIIFSIFQVGGRSAESRSASWPTGSAGLRC